MLAWRSCSGGVNRVALQRGKCNPGVIQWTAKSAGANLPCTMRLDALMETRADHQALNRGPVTDRAAALAPGGVGNIGPGLDVLGLAVTRPGDRVVAARADQRGVTMADTGPTELPREAARNAAGIAAIAVLVRAGAGDLGVRLTLEKRLPLSGGQG